MGRAPCCDKKGLKKGPWTPEEDQKLIDYIRKHGYGNWRTLPKHAGLQRCGKSCRLRWTNYLRPDIKRGRFTFEEEETIIHLHSILGNKWSAIASRLPGRTDNEIKNYWNTHIRKRLLRMGIDPVTHSLRLDLLDLSSLLASNLYASSSSQVAYNNSDIGRFLNGIQPLQLNSELQKLAYSSLIPAISQQQPEILSFWSQNYGQENQISYHNDNLFQAQEMPSASTYVDPNSSNVINHVPDQSQSYSYNYGHQNSLIDPLLLICETSNFQYSNNSNHNFSFDQSVLSTPSSSPTPLNSNYSTCTDQDERDNGGSSSNNMLKIEIPDVLDVNEFM